MALGTHAIEETMSELAVILHREGPDAIYRRWDIDSGALLEHACEYARLPVLGDGYSERATAFMSGASFALQLVSKLREER